MDQFTADILATTEVQRARMMAAYRQWDENTLKSAIDPNWDQHSFFERAYTDNHLMDWAHQITTHIDQRYICRKVSCQAVIDNKHWLRKISPDATIASQHGKYYCPHCLWRYCPWVEEPGLVPAQKALVVAVKEGTDFATATGAQVLKDRRATTGPDTNARQHILYLMDWKRTKEDVLAQKLKAAILGIQEEVSSRDNFNVFIVAAIKDSAAKSQPLPYFQRETWNPDLVRDIIYRNTAARPPLRLDLLPTVQRPDKFFNGAFNDPATARGYTMENFVADPPIYDMTRYSWDPDTTKVMSQNDFCRFIALSYLRLRLIQDHASGLLRTTVKRDASQMSA